MHLHQGAYGCNSKNIDSFYIEINKNSDALRLKVIS